MAYSLRTRSFSDLWPPPADRLDGHAGCDYANLTVANGWQHCLTVPCELKRDGERLLRIPAREISVLRGEHIPTERAQVFDMVLH